MEDAPVTRDEFNRLLADLQILRMLVAHDIGHRWGSERVDHWYHTRAAAFDNANEQPTVIANMTRALDEMAKRLRLAAGRSS